MDALKNNVADLLWDGPGSDMQVLRVEAHSALSEMPVTEVELRSPDPNIDFSQMLRAETKIKIKCGPELQDTRILKGLITRFYHKRSRHGNLRTSSTKVYSYEVEIRPALWLLTRRFKSQIYQKMTVKDIVSEILDEFSVRFQWKTQRSTRSRMYCVQFQETDFSFISRLLEDEGICFFIDEEKDEVIFADDPSAFDPCKPTDEVPYIEDGGGSFSYGRHEMIREFAYREEISRGKVTLHHYNYETSQTNLQTCKNAPDAPCFGDLESYHHAMIYHDLGEGRDYASVQTDEAYACGIEASGSSSCRSFATGHVMKMKDHFREAYNIRWLLTSVSISATQGDFDCFFTAQPADKVYRPPMRTPRPRVMGTQTAMVTGPSGSEVYLDEMGRCKIQFHWDRDGERDDRSSMWVRVSNGYAGRDYGIQWIPRVGNEVLVAFVNGDPDLPVVVGRLYNDFNTPPLGPAEKYQNIIKDICDNHMMFDASEGKEVYDMRAQRNMNVTVVNDQSVSVGGNQGISVGNDRSVSVGNDETVEVGANQSTTVGADQTNQVASNQNETVGANVEQQIGGTYAQVVAGDSSTQVGGGRTTIVSAMDSTNCGAYQCISQGKGEITCAGSFDLTAAGTTSLKSAGATNVTAGGGIDMSAPSVSIKAGSISLSCGGGSITITPAGVTLTGLLKHNC